MNRLMSGLEKLRLYVNEDAKIILWFFLITAVLVFSLNSLLSVTFPYSLDYGEAPLIDQATRMADGENIYRSNISTPPYTIANYPPGYVLTLAPFTNTSISPFITGRLISVLATILSAIFIGLTIFSFSEDRLSAVTAAAFFLAVPYVVQWSGLARIDSLALAFATGAIYILARWSHTRWSWIAAGLLLVAAAYTRQSYALAAPFAAFIWLWTQNKRRAVSLFLLVAVLGGALFFLINQLTGGGFYYNIITANVNEFSWLRVQDQFRRLLEDAWIILLLGALFLGIGWRSQKSWLLIAPFLVGAFISALTIGKIGSNINYFLELAAALALAAGALISWSKPNPWRHAAVIGLVCFQFGILMRSSMNNNVDWNLATHQRDFTALQLLEQEVIHMPDPVLADENMDLLTLNDRHLYMQPFEVTQLAIMGKWDQQPVLDSIEAHSFSGILIHHFGVWPVYKERWSPEMLTAIDANYRPVKTLAGTVIYIPRKDSGIAPIPAAQQSSKSAGSLDWDGQVIPISDAGFMAQPSIAVHPTDPNLLTALATSFSKQDCQLPTCKVELTYYISNDAGSSWQQRTTLSRPQQPQFAGQLNFDPDGDLILSGLRGDIFVLQRITSANDYLPDQTAFDEITASQVAARPWLQINPQTNELYLSLDAQEGNNLFTTPGLMRSSDGEKWSTTTRVDQHISTADIFSPRATGPDDIQALPGAGNNLSLLWAWDPVPWTWPRTVWMANSNDDGATFGEPTAIAKSWGPPRSVSANGQIVVVYRSGREGAQKLAVAVTSDDGHSWISTLASGDIPLYFDVNNTPAISIAPNGSIDLVFYAHASSAASCMQTLESWRSGLPGGQADTCQYDVYYTHSSDGGKTFDQPLKLNQQPILGQDFVRFSAAPLWDAPLAITSSDDFAYPVWIGSAQNGKTRVFTTRIAH